MPKASRIAEIWTRIGKISAGSGKNRWTLLKDYLHLRHSIHMSIEEYENFRIYSRDDAFRQNFLPYLQADRYWTILNPLKHACLARDKFLSHCILEAASIPVPKLIAYYNPEIACSTDILAGSYEQIAYILRTKGVTSFVMKPAQDSAHGSGVIVCRQLVERGKELYMQKFNGNEISLRNSLDQTPMIFEETIGQTEQMSSFNASSLNTVRVMTALYPDQHVDIIATFVKIGRNGSDVDNAGSGGNVDCGVDSNTGELFHAIQFNSWQDITPIERHPDSGTQLNGVIISGWNNIIDKIKSYQARLPQLKTIGWDVAITDNGPIIIEINNWWDTTGQEFINRGWAPQVKNCYDAWTLYKQ